VIELQATAEDKPVDWEIFMTLKALAERGIRELAEIQRKAVSEAG